jgi:zinc protease
MKIHKINRRTLVAICALIAFICSGSYVRSTNAQGGGAAPQSTKGAVVKGRAPVNKNVLQVKLPKAQETTLANGLRVILLSDDKVPTFSAQIVILSGGLADKADFRGLSSFTAALLREGTTKRSSKDIAEQVDALGATLNSNSGFSSMTSVVSTSGLVENLDQTFDRFADIVR